MADFGAHVFVCTNTEGAEDRRHCGDKGGAEVRQRFNELLVERKLLEKVTISKVGCTSQHGRCDGTQSNVIVYGPNHALGGTWYTASPDDVGEIITEHLIGGRVVERIQNPDRGVKFT